MYTPDPYDSSPDPYDSIGPRDLEYSLAVNKLSDEIEYFTERLSQQDENRFAYLIALYEYVHSIEKREAFAQGIEASTCATCGDRKRELQD